MKVCYLTPSNSVHDDTWLSELRKYFEVVADEADIYQAGPLFTKAAFAAVEGLRPLVGMSWGFDILEDKSARTAFAVQHSDLLLSDSNVVSEKLQELGAKRIHQIPWGVDLEQFIPQDSGNTRPKLLTTRRRGLDVVRKAHTAANGAAGLLISVSLEHEKMPKMYHESDLYICASPSDGSSVSLLEAMACGLPVIVYDSAGNREWVQQGVNGWLCEDVNSFAQAIVEAARMGPAERKRMGEANRAVVEARADWHKNFLKLVEVYHGLGK